MGISEILALIGGLCLFLFGMSTMSSSLEKSAGSRLKTILGNMTGNPLKGFVLGLIVTVVIQSSSATTVMVVGFVNSGIMTLSQSVGVIMGANLGASVTSWLLSTSGISGAGWLEIFKPSSFTPVLALIGIVLFMFVKSQKKKDIGAILLGFSVLMFGMEAMSGSVSGLADDPAFGSLFTMFSNPIIGVLAGLTVTAIIQSSGASVGILQALSLTGKITCASAVPIIMGQNIGTCVTAMLSCIGAGKNARRAAIIHLSFNVIATIILLPIWYILESTVPMFEALAKTATNPLIIAIIHTVFKIIALMILMPANKLLVKLAYLLVPDKGEDKNAVLLDERLLVTPPAALVRSKAVISDMAKLSIGSMKKSLGLIYNYDPALASEIREEEGEVDKFEDALGSYLVKLSAQGLSSGDSREATKMLHLIGDFERISDHSVNILESIEEANDKKYSFTDDAKRDLAVLTSAVSEILDLTLASFESETVESASLVEPLEQVIDDLKEELRTRHIDRLQKGECTIEVGFIWSDMLTNLERVADHCSNIAGCEMDMAQDNLNLHESLSHMKLDDGKFKEDYQKYAQKYAV